MGVTDPRIPSKPICGGTGFGRILKSDHSGRIFVLPRLRRRHSGARRVSVLSELTVGECGTLVALDLPESVQNHLMHMGFVLGACVTALRRAPAGDPTVYRVDGLEIALRHETAEAIRMRPSEPALPQSEIPGAVPEKARQLAEAGR